MSKRILPLAAALALLPATALAAGSHHLDVGGLVFFIIHFAIFAGAIIYFAKGGVKSFFAARRDTISKDLDEAQTVRAEALELLATLEARMEDVAKEREAIAERFRADGEREKARLLSEAREETARMRKEAEFRISQEAKKARERLSEEAAKLAMELADKAVRERLDATARKRLFDEAIGELEKIRPEQVLSS